MYELTHTSESPRTFAAWAIFALISCAPPTAAPPTVTDPGSLGGADASDVPEDAADVPEEPPAVSPELNRPYETKRSAETWAQNFEREGREAFDQKAEILARLHLKTGMRIADIGAGTGLFTLDFARAVAPDGHVIAIDLQDYFLAHIAGKVESAGLENVSTHKSTPRSAQLPASSIDLAFMCDVYHHIEYPRSYLASLHTALVPGGRIALIDFIRPDPERVEEDRKWVLEHVRASPETFRSEFETAGFRLVETHEFLDENFFFVFEKPAT